jgi:hypothetical protein
MSGLGDFAAILLLCVAVPGISLCGVVWIRDQKRNLGTLSILSAPATENQFDIDTRMLVLWFKTRRWWRFLVQLRTLVSSYICYKQEDLYGWSDLFATLVAFLVAILMAADFVWEFVTGTSKTWT